MRCGNSRPNSKKSKLKEIKENETLTNSMTNVDKTISLEEDIRKGNYTLKPIKRRRNMDLEKLKSLIMEDIIKRSKSDNWLDKMITKEHSARTLEVKEHLVEQVFQQLNIEGILSQRRPEYAHDTNRNWLFSGNKSGWAEDTYKILI